MSSTLWANARANSLSYGRAETAFTRRLVKPPLNPIADATPFAPIRTITALPTLLLDFVSVMKKERFHDRAIGKVEKIAKWFPSWQAKQPSSVLEGLTICTLADIRTLIFDVATSHHGQSDEQYVDYQGEWRWVHAALVAMQCKTQWHPHNIWYSALFHSAYYGCGRSLRAQRLLTHCYVLPSICGHLSAHGAKTKAVIARNADNHDVRSFFQFDPALYGGRKVRKPRRRKFVRVTGAKQVLLEAVPVSSQQVLQCQRTRKEVKKVLKGATRTKKGHVRKLDFWFKRESKKQ